MPRMSKSEAPDQLTLEGYEGAFGELGPEYTVGFERYTADADLSPMFEGLPDDRCQCPHWGVVISGKIVFRYADHDETYVAGDAYYGAPGHLPLLFADTELIEFSPTAALNETMQVIDANLTAVKSGMSAPG